jgi:hypothetical protein
LLSTNDHKSTERIIALNDFFQEETTAYKQFITDSNDYYSYVQKIKIEAGRLEALGFGSGGGSKSTPGRNSTGNSNTVKVIRTEGRRETNESRRNNLMSNENGNKELVSELMSKLNENTKPTSGFRGIKCTFYAI